MSIQIPKAFSEGYRDTAYPSKNNTLAGSKNDQATDVRSAKVKTPKTAWRPPTPYSRTVESGCVKGVDLSGTVLGTYPTIRGSQVYQTRTGFCDFGGYYYAGVPAVPVDFRNRLVTKALLKLKNETVNLSQAFVERGQTVDLVVENLKRLRYAVKAVRRLDADAALRALGARGKRHNAKSPFELWLEIQYGWKPLLSDCHGAVTALSDKEHEDRDRYKATVKASYRMDDKSLNQLPDYQCNGWPKVRAVKSSEVHHKGWIRLDYIKADSALLPTAASLGLTNPLELVWEELPFSFVVDWFLPIGSYLSTFDATYGWTFKGGSVSIKSTMRTRCLPDPKIIDNATTAYRSGGLVPQGRGYQMKFVRETYSTSPTAQVPHPKNPVSGLHVSEAIALLAGAFR